MTTLDWLLFWMTLFLTGWWFPEIVSLIMLVVRPVERAIVSGARKVIGGPKKQGERQLFQASKDLAVPEQKKTYEMFDHPAAPIMVLSAALPSAPTGYGWEMTTAPNEHGNPALRLSLLSLAADTTAVESIEADLVVVRRWKYAAPDTYAAFYRRAEEQANKTIIGVQYRGPGWHDPTYASPTKVQGEVMMANLITPLVDWARLVTLRYIVENPDPTKVNYVLIPAPEGVLV